jgi:CheY-like chemotaxis protein
MNRASTPVNNFRQARILVVEDNYDHWIIIRTVLKECLAEVEPIWAANADEALDYLNAAADQQQVLPKLILLDLYLPDRATGWHILEQLKKPASPFLKLPVVILSHSNDPSDISLSYRYGGTSYLIKPLNYADWVAHFQMLRHYWWEVVTLPSKQS